MAVSYLKGPSSKSFAARSVFIKDDAACTCKHPSYFNGARKTGDVSNIFPQVLITGFHQ
jgi:hypothetical protein